MDCNPTFLRIMIKSRVVARMMLDIPMHAGLKRDNLQDLRVNERKMLKKCYGNRMAVCEEDQFGSG